LFRANLFVLYFIYVLAFYALVLIFAALIAAAGQGEPSCMRVGSLGLGDLRHGAIFSSVFTLSWTTFSTVVRGLLLLGSRLLLDALSTVSADMLASI